MKPRLRFCARCLGCARIGGRASYIHTCMHACMHTYTLPGDYTATLRGCRSGRSSTISTLPLRRHMVRRHAPVSEPAYVRGAWCVTRSGVLSRHILQSRLVLRMQRTPGLGPGRSSADSRPPCLPGSRLGTRQVARAILAWLKLHKRHILNGPTSLELAMSKLQTQALPRSHAAIRAAHPTSPPVCTPRHPRASIGCALPSQLALIAGGIDVPLGSAAVGAETNQHSEPKPKPI